MQENIYSWEFSSNKQRGKSWYIIALSIIIGLVLWGFFSKQYAMSFLILLITGVVYFVENNTEDIIKIDILELGIKIGSSFYDFPKIISYSILYRGEDAILIRLKLNKKGIKILDLGLNNNIASDLEKILPNYIAENKKEELSFSDKIILFLKL